MVDPAKVAAIDPTTHQVTFAPGSGVREGGELIATPALADLDGDGRAEIVVGAQEEYGEPPNIGDGARRARAARRDGDARQQPRVRASSPGCDGALPGWPAKIALVQTELLPTIGDGVAMPAAIGDVHPTHPGPEIIVGLGRRTALRARRARATASTARARRGATCRCSGRPASASRTPGMFGPNRNSNDLVASMVGFGGPSFGDLDGDGVADVTAPTAGLTRLIDLLVPDLQLPSDDQLSTWDGATRLPLVGLAAGDRPTSRSSSRPPSPTSTATVASESIAGNSTYTIVRVRRRGRRAERLAQAHRRLGRRHARRRRLGRRRHARGRAAPPRRRRCSCGTRRGPNRASWAAWGCDQFHSGSCTTAVVEPPPTTTTTTTTTEPSTTTTDPAPSDVAAAESTTGTLPATGRDIALLVLIALACIAIGLALTQARRRRR